MTSFFKRPLKNWEIVAWFCGALLLIALVTPWDEYYAHRNNILPLLGVLFLISGTTIALRRAKNKVICVLAMMAIAVVICAIVVMTVKPYMFSELPKKIRIERVSGIPFKEYLATNHITNYRMARDTDPQMPQGRVGERGKLHITFPGSDNAVAVSRGYDGIFASPIVICDTTGVGVVTGDNCMGPLSAIKYTYQGKEVWRYEPPGSGHPHGVGILAPRRRLVILWDFDPQEPVEGVSLLHFVDWDTGRRVAWVSAAFHTKGMALDQNEEFLYLSGDRGIGRVKLDDCYPLGRHMPSQESL